jgi:hypothetical protein
MKKLLKDLQRFLNFLERRKMLNKASNSSLNILIDTTAPWASNWNEILLYLRGPGMKNPEFTVNEVIWLIDEIKTLRDENFPYTTNVEKIWEHIH